MTGSIGLPMMLPWPAGKKCTTAPAAAISVTHSAAADEVSIKYKPGPFRGASAGFKTLITGRLPVFSMLPSAFSSIVDSPPAILPCVGCDPRTYSILKDKIIKREFNPRQKLSIPELSEQLGVSRTPVRDALNLLEKDGLVKTVSKVGTFVTAISAEDVLEIMDTRLMIEHWVVEHLPKRSAAEIQSAIASMEKIQEVSTYVVGHSRLEAYHEGDYNLLFHMEFIKLGGTKRFWKCTGI
ncbi:GntR family transcriptional regulator [Paenibacillus thermoaerophilus]|nr:GntR family transcriptional regulator [Paenibacillus thermoaerophilus]